MAGRGTYNESVMIDSQPFNKLREWGRLLQLSRQVRRGWKAWEQTGDPDRIMRQCRNRWISTDEAELLQRLLTSKFENDSLPDTRQALLVLRSLAVGDFPIQEELMENYLRPLLEYVQSCRVKLQAARQHGTQQDVQKVQTRLQKDPDYQFLQQHPELASFWLIWLLDNRGNRHDVPPYWLSLAARSPEAQSQPEFRRILQECQAPEVVATLAEQAGPEEFGEFVDDMLQMSHDQKAPWGQKLAQLLTRASDQQLQQLDRKQVEQLLQHPQGAVRQAGLRLAQQIPGNNPESPASSTPDQTDDLNTPQPDHPRPPTP